MEWPIDNPLISCYPFSMSKLITAKMIYLTQDLKDALKAEAITRDVTQSVIVREALERHFRNQK